MSVTARLMVLAAILVLAMPARLFAAETQSQTGPVPGPEATKPEPTATDTKLFLYVTGLDSKGFNWLALRRSPSFHASWSATQIPPDTLLARLGSQGEWMNVALASGEAGWVRARYLACCRRADASPASSSDSRAWITLDGRDLVGGDHTESDAKTLQACESQCESDSACRGYSFDRWNHVCSLKSTVGSLRLDPRALSVVLSDGGQLADDPAPPIIQTRRSKSFGDPSYSQSPMASYDLCSAACLGDQDCNAFNYRQSDKICALVQSPSEYHDDSGTDIGIKVQPR